MSLLNKTTSGLLWNFLEQISRNGTTIAVTFLLAYYLVPSDYGTIAIISIIISASMSIMESGFKQALVSVKNIDDSLLNSVFFTNLLMGSFVYIVIFCFNDKILNFFNTSNEYVLRVACITVIINTFQVVPVSILLKKMDFRSILLSNIPASIISGLLSVVVAYLGFGYWALVFQIIVNALISNYFIWRKTNWNPCFHFSFSKAFKLYKFGFKLMVSELLDIIFRNVYVIVIAKTMSSSVLGLYFFSDKIRDILVYQMVQTIQNVSFPALASIQEDNYRLKNAYRRMIAITSYIFFPFVVFFVTFSDLIVTIFLPDKWVECEHYVQLMVLSGLLYPLHSINLNILKVKGRSDIFLYLEIFKKFLVVFIIFLTYDYGIISILYGQLFFSFISYIPNSYFGCAIIDYKYKEQFIDFMPPLILSFFSAMLCYFFIYFIDLNKYFEFFMILFFYLLTYTAFSSILNFKGFMEVKIIYKSRFLIRK